MKNLSANKTPQAICSGDVVGGSVVRGMLGAFCFKGGDKSTAGKKQGIPAAQSAMICPYVPWF